MSSLAKKLGVYDYKKTNLNWLPYIPNHWELKRLKEVSKSMGSGATPMTNIDGYYENGILNWVNTGDLNDGIIDECKYKISQLAINNYPNLKIYKPGTLLIAMYGATIGKIGLLNISATTNQACCCITLNNYNYNKYYFYCFIAFKEYLISLSVGGTQPNVGQGIISKIILCSPPLTEQTQIANYLDTKTQAIDKKINLLTTKIEYYKELRKTIINNAVTKGLDKNVKLKESELGFEIPTIWQSYRLKDIGYLYSGLSGKAGDDFNQDDNPNNKGFIPFTNIANNTYLKKDHLGTVVVYDNEKQNKVRKGDIFFLMSSEGYEDIGKTAVLDEDIKDTYLNSFCKGYRLNMRFCYPSFINYLLLSTNYRSQLITEGKGFTRINLKMEKVTDFIVYLPPTQKEQTEIATYLDTKTSTIDKITTNLQTQIETLKELRKTLINDVVTGKVKVTK